MPQHSTPSSPSGAGLVLHNGKIITVDAGFTVAESIAVDGNRIMAVGDTSEILAFAGSHARRIDLKGKSVVPGLIDAHAHMDREGLKDVYPSLAGARSIDEVLELIRALVADAKPGEWIVTMPIGDPPSYWDTPNNLKEMRFPDRRDLDRVAPDNPVYIRAIWGFWRHALPLVSIANTRALEIAGIGPETRAPCDTVTIERGDDGAPSGIFTEWSYMPIVELTLMRACGGFTAEDRIEGLRRSMRAYHACGTTSVFEEHGVAGEVLAAYRTLHEHGELTMRSNLVVSPSWNAVAGVPVGGLMRSWGSWMAGRGLGDAMLRVGGLYVLLESDGEGPRSPVENAARATASPYTGWAGFHYDAGLPRDRLKEVLVEAARNDIRAVGLTTDLIDLYQEVDRVVPISDRRWVLGHIGILEHDDIARIRDLGLAVSTHTNRNIYRTGAALREQVGADREDTISPLKSLRDAGVRFALATDNVPVSMFYPIWEAVARKDRASGEVIASGQRLSREEALRAATIDGAHITFEENEKGSLEAGKLADFACLTGDPLTVPEDEIKDIVAEFTVVDGEIVYERGGA